MQEQVTVTETGIIERTLDVVLPSADVSSEVDRKLAEIGRNASLPGFRPGKVPMSIVRKKYSAGTATRVITDMLDEVISKTIEDQELDSAGIVDIELPAYEAGKDMEIKVVLDLFPEIGTIDLNGVAIEKPVCEFSEEEVDQTIEELRRNNPVWVDKEEGAREGDGVEIVLSTAGDSSEEEEETVTVLGSGELLDELEEGLLGAKAGDSLSVTCTYPDEFADATLSGKMVTYDVSVKKVHSRELPEVNDEFVRNFGIQEGGVEKFREEVKSSMEREWSQRVRARLREQVFDKLLESNEPVEIPRPIERDRIEPLLEKLTEGSEDPEQKEHQANILRGNVAMELIIRKAVRHHDIQLDEERVVMTLSLLSQAYQDPQAYLNAIRSRPEEMEQIKARVLQEQTVDALLETADVKEVVMGFQEFMNPVASTETGEEGKAA